MFAYELRGGYGSGWPGVVSIWFIEISTQVSSITWSEQVSNRASLNKADRFVPCFYRESSNDDGFAL